MLIMNSKIDTVGRCFNQIIFLLVSKCFQLYVLLKVKYTCIFVPWMLLMLYFMVWHFLLSRSFQHRVLDLTTFNFIFLLGIANGEILQKLESGYRQPKPANCPQEVYDAVISCWQENPARRPSFASLYATLRSMQIV